MSSVRSAPVAIIGGGFSGTVLGAQLARRGIGSIVIEGGGRAGRGTAYSTAEPAHLLNIPAERMSAWPSEPDDFTKLFEAQGGSGHDFAERRLYGSYLSAILDEAVASGHVRIVNAAALAAKREGGTWHLALDDGTRVEAGSLTLAIGNQEPEALKGFEHVGERFVANPWGEAAARAIAALADSGQDALIIGTGLTMVDLALSLDAAGHRGRIIAMSRRGQLPRSSVFSDAPKLEVGVDELTLGDLRSLARWLRERSAHSGWRNAVDSLRPHSHRIWGSLNIDQQRRFMRHARAWWDVHRHRLAPQVGATIARMIGEGRLEIMSARLVAVEDREDGFNVRYRRRGGSEVGELEAGFAFNSTGPLHAISHTGDPLLRSLMESGVARPDALDIGVLVDERSRVCGSERLWALGALSKGRYWEIIAVPDIRGQVAAVAEDIAGELASATEPAGK
ncbi:MAG: FAD/NAD(P)-binding protein [Sphingomicrobium sp.]